MRIGTQREQCISLDNAGRILYVVYIAQDTWLLLTFLAKTPLFSLMVELNETFFWESFTISDSSNVTKVSSNFSERKLFYVTWLQRDFVYITSNKDKHLSVKESLYFISLLIREICILKKYMQYGTGIVTSDNLKTINCTLLKKKFKLSLK